MWPSSFKGYLGGIIFGWVFDILKKYRACDQSYSDFLGQSKRLQEQWPQSKAKMKCLGPVLDCILAIQSYILEVKMNGLYVGFHQYDLLKFLQIHFASLWHPFFNGEWGVTRVHKICVLHYSMASIGFVCNLYWDIQSRENNWVW